MKRYLVLLMILFATNVYADSAIENLTNDASPDGADLIVTVDDVAGTPTNKKATIANLLVDGNIPDTITIDLSGTATALAADPTDCSAGSYTLGINASGTAQSCTDATTEIDSAIATHAAIDIPLGPGTSGNYVSNATASKGLVLTGTEGGSLGLIESCNDGELLKSTSGNWACAVDNNSGGSGSDMWQYSSGQIVPVATTVDFNFDSASLFVDISTDRVGVGTSTPSTALDVNGTVTADAVVITGSGQTTIDKGLIVNNSSGNASTDDLQVKGDTDDYLISTDADNNRVGIGTSAPSVLFEVDGDAQMADLTLTGTLIIGSAIIPQTFEKCFTLEDPVATDDNIPIFSPKYDITVTNMNCIQRGGTNIPITLSDGTNAMDTLTCLATLTQDDGSIANASLTAGETLEFDSGTLSGTPTWVNFCFTYEVD